MTLEKAIRDYIESEITINESQRKEKDLLEKHANSLEDNNVFSVEEAEKAFRLYNDIRKHKEGVESSRLKKENAVKVIAQYLEATNKKPIHYSYNRGTSGYTTYSFLLNEKGEVVHNR